MHKTLICILLAAAAFSAGIDHARAQSKENVTYPNAVIPGLGGPVTVYAGIYKPRGNGPFPAVIVLHGCGGTDYHHKAWAERLVSWGYVALVPDSFMSRGHKSLCTQTTLVPPEMRVSDIIGSAEYLAGLPYVAKDKIGLVGFSHGGWTIMKAVQERYQLKAFGIRGAVAYYPYCNPKQDTKISIPLLVLIGEDDSWTPALLCRELQANEALKSAAPTEMVFYPGAYHSFDRPERVIEVDGWSVGGGVKKHKSGGNPAAAEDSFNRSKAFFERVFAAANN